MLESFKNIVFLLLFSVLIAFTGCFGINYLLKKPKPIKRQIEVVEKNIIVDSLLIVVDSLTVQVDSLHRQESKPKLIYFMQEVDTALIIEQHFKTLKQSVKHRDKKIDLKLDFDLHRNKVTSPKLQYKILQPTTTIYKVNETKQKHFLAGITVGGSEFELDQFTPELIYISGKHGFKLGYNIFNENKNIQIGYYFKLN